MRGRAREVDAVTFEHDHDDAAGYDNSSLDVSPRTLGLLDDLRGRRTVVTGAARGIGEAIAKWLIMAGADVTVIDKDCGSRGRTADSWLASRFVSGGE